MARLAIVVKVLLVVCLVAGAEWGHAQDPQLAGGFAIFPEYIDHVGPNETLMFSIVGIDLQNVELVDITSSSPGIPQGRTFSPGVNGDAVVGEISVTTPSTFDGTQTLVVQVGPITVHSGTDEEEFTADYLELKAQLNPAVQYAGNRREGVFPGEEVQIFALLDASKFSVPPTSLRARIRPHSKLEETQKFDVPLSPALDQPVDLENPSRMLYTGTLPSSFTEGNDLGDYFIDIEAEGTNVVPLPISAAGGFALAHTIVSFPDPMLIAPSATTASVPVLVEDDGLGPAGQGFTTASLRMRIADEGLTPSSPTMTDGLTGGPLSSSSVAGPDWLTLTANLTKPNNQKILNQYEQTVLASVNVGVTGTDGMMSFDVESAEFDGSDDGVAALGWSVLERGLGDVDGNGQIGALDASLVLMHTVGKVNLEVPGPLTTSDPDVESIVGTGWNVPHNAVRNADVSGMLGITPLDASFILRRRVLDISYFMPEGKAYRLWDAPTGRWNPPIWTGSGVAKRVADGQDAIDRTVSLGTVEERDGLLAVPVLIDNMDRVLAGSLTLEFDPQQVQPVRVQGGELTQDYLFADNAEGNTLRVSFAGITWKGEQGTLAEIQLRPLAGTSAADVRLTEVELNEGWTSARIGQASALPRSLALYPNFPNPFNPSTTLRFDLPQNGPVELTVYNVVGQQVRTLVKGVQEAGHYKLEWDGTDDAGRQVASGTYMARLESAAGVLVQKMLMVK